MANLWPMRVKSLSVFATLSLLVLLGGCETLSDFFRQRPQALPPASELYAEGETQLNKSRFEEARTAFRKVAERHPQSSYAPRARFLIGEAYYREGQFDKAIKEFEAFMSFYPRHEISDLVQFRLAMSYYDQMKPVEQDQEITRKSMEAFRVLVREYPESRYAADALAKIDICRGKLAQKELWVAGYYFNQGNTAAARPRLEFVIKEYPRTLVIPEALYTLAEVNVAEGKTREAADLFRQCANEYGYTDFGKRASQRLRSLPGAQR
jgi:outer membrane protein assembly factor BamD